MSDKKEIEKDYNKKYYATNKQRIKEMLCKKETCPLCGRKNLNHQNMPKHQAKGICERNRPKHKLYLQMIEPTNQKPTFGDLVDLIDIKDEHKQLMKAWADEYKNKTV